jgi:hypothetical protein
MPGLPKRTVGESAVASSCRIVNIRFSTCMYTDRAAFSSLFSNLSEKYLPGRRLRSDAFETARMDAGRTERSHCCSPATLVATPTSAKTRCAARIAERPAPAVWSKLIFPLKFCHPVTTDQFKAISQGRWRAVCCVSKLVLVDYGLWAANG